MKLLSFHLCFHDNYSKISFYFDQSDGTLRFNQLNQTWGIDLVENITESSFGGLWYFGDGTSLCLDYDDINLIDSCYEAVDIKNTYFDQSGNLFFNVDVEVSQGRVLLTGTVENMDLFHFHHHLKLF